jgi:general stress protein 26
MSEPRPVRPDMPDGYGIGDNDPARHPWARAEERLAQGRNLWVVTASPQAGPHSLPVWYLWLDGAAWFSTDPTSRKGRNLAADPRVAVHLESGDDVVVLRGVAERVTDTSLLERFAEDYERKYGIRVDGANPAMGVYRVAPQSALTWLEADYTGTALRWEF